MFIGILNKFILLLCPDESPIFKPSFTWLEKKMIQLAQSILDLFF